MLLRIDKTTVSGVQNDSPVMNTPTSLDSLVANTPGSLDSPVVNTPGSLDSPADEYTGESTSWCTLNKDQNMFTKKLFNL